MENRPNILIVMPDQMRGDCMSLENHPVLSTPNIDQIGLKGTHFKRAYTTCASCIPARRAMLTGQHPVSNSIMGVASSPLSVPTITQILNESGYATSLVGRYMHQIPYEEPYGFEKRIMGSTYIRNDDYDKYLKREVPDFEGIEDLGLTFNGRNSKAWPLGESHHPTNWTARESRKLLAESNSDRPVFMVSSFYAPHPPLFPPASYMNHFLNMEMPAPVVGDWEKRPVKESFINNVDANRVDLTGKELVQAQAGYFGLIEHIDDQLTELLEDFKNKSSKEGRPWIIIFTSDHGEMLGDHYLFRKCEPYEGSSRIPMLIQGSPEMKFKSQVSYEYPVCLEDIMPTLLELTGTCSKTQIDGKSLVSVLRGEQKEPVRAVLHCEHAPHYDQDQGYHLLTDGKKKYIWRPNDGSEQLFDIENDPQETHNLSSRTEEVKIWRQKLIQKLKKRPEGFSDGKQLFAGCNYTPQPCKKI